LVVEMCAATGLLENGVYEVIRHPYYGGAMGGPSEVFSWAVRWIGPSPGDICTSGFPVEHLCRYCDKQVRRWAILHRSYR
jgi:hypothetical protein